MKYALIALLLAGCAQDQPLLLADCSDKQVIVLACSDISADCIQHSVMDCGTVYNRSMVHQPDNEAYTVIIDGDNVILRSY